MNNIYRKITAITALASVLIVSGCSSGNSPAGTSSPPGTAANSPSANSGAVQSAVPTPQTSPAAAQTTSPASSPSQNDDPIALQVAEMTIEEKIGQMLLAGIDGTQVDSQAKRMIAEDGIGGIILYKDNILNLKSMVTLINDLKKSNSVNPVPLFMSVDQEGGKVSRMPDEYAAMPGSGKVGTAGNPDSARMMGSLLAREVLSAGFNMNFAPVLDINSNPANPVIGDRSFGSTAEIVTPLGIAEMKGIAEAGVIPVVKHFPGHGDTSVDSHLELPVVNKSAAELAKLEWLPFQAAIKEQADAVMVAHILYPELDTDKPASLSKPIIGELLREQMGYNGVVITDDLTMGAITDHYTLAAAAVDTVLAGSDILLIAHNYENEQAVRNALLTNVKDGTIAETRINESVYRILSLKHKYKLSDHPLPVPDLTELNKEITAWKKTLTQ